MSFLGAWAVIIFHIVSLLPQRTAKKQLLERPETPSISVSYRVKNTAGILGANHRFGIKLLSLFNLFFQNCNACMNIPNIGRGSETEHTA